MGSKGDFIRVKFECERTGVFKLQSASKELALLQDIVQQMEAFGAAPPLPDGLVSALCYSVGVRLFGTLLSGYALDLSSHRGLPVLLPASVAVKCQGISRLSVLSTLPQPRPNLYRVHVLLSKLVLESNSRYAG